jgi:hypothetical protein
MNRKKEWIICCYQEEENMEWFCEVCGFNFGYDLQPFFWNIQTAGIRLMGNIHHIGSMLMLNVQDAAIYLNGKTVVRRLYARVN